jgi:ATP-dependent Clp protease ATP-binding subunit ClpA
MADRFDKFTERARKVLQLAQEEAQRFNHNYIGTEHLLLGLLRVESSVASRALTALDVELSSVRAAVELIIGRGDSPVTADIGLTPRAKKSIELAVDEARRFGHHYVGTEHLLLGLVREGSGIAAGVLENLGVSLDKARVQVRAELEESERQASSSASAGTSAPERRPRSTWPMQMKWEHLMVEVDLSDDLAAGAIGDYLAGQASPAYWLPSLQPFGDLGWRLAGVVPVPRKPNRYRFFMHRPKE